MTSNRLKRLMACRLCFSLSSSERSLIFDFLGSLVAGAATASIKPDFVSSMFLAVQGRSSDDELYDRSWLASFKRIVLIPLKFLLWFLLLTMNSNRFVSWGGAGPIRFFTSSLYLLPNQIYSWTGLSTKNCPMASAALAASVAGSSYVSWFFL